MSQNKAPLLPIRSLAWFAFPFGAGCLLCGGLLSAPTALLLGAALLLAAVFLLFLLRQSWRLRPILCLLGLALGLGWCACYTLLHTSATADLSGQVTELHGYVLTNPVSYDTYDRVTLYLPGYGNAYLYLSSGADLSVGDALSLSGTVSAGTTANQAAGISLRISATSVEILGSSNALRFWPARLRALFQDCIHSLYSGDVASLFCALLTGDKTGLPTALRTAFSRCGLSHLLAVSGLHITCLSGLCFLFLPGRRARLLCLPALIFFTLMVGSVSAWRALLMAALVLIAPLLRREPDSLTSLAFALLVLLCLNPLSALSIGLQLSFASMLGLILVAPRLLRFWSLRLSDTNSPPRSTLPLLRWGLSAASVSASALVFTIPLTIWYFRELSLIALPANLAVTWMLTFLLGLGLLSVLFYLPLPLLGQLLAIPASLLARLILFLVRTMSGFAFSSLILNNPYILAWCLFALVMVILAVLMVRKHHRPTLPICGIILILCLALVLNRSQNLQTTLTVEVLDVGQGQSILLMSQGYTAAIDCGGNGSDSAGDILADALQSLSTSTLDLLVLTHMDSDHVNGMEELFARITVSTVIVPDCQDLEDSAWAATLFSLCEEQGSQVLTLSEELVLTFGAAQVTIYPPMEDSGNNSSLASLWQTEGFSLLVTGDLDSTGEWLLLAHESLPDIDLLIAGHHGSASSTSARLLEAVTPETCIISVGSNSYGHPTEETLSRLAEYSITTYRTDLSGTIIISIQD